MRSGRQIALVVLALLLAVLFAYPGSGLVLGWSSAEHGGIHRFHTQDRRFGRRALDHRRADAPP